MKGIYNKKLNKTFAGIVGGAGCGILVILVYLGNESSFSKLSVYHFGFLIGVLIYICTATAITMYLENINYFQENANEKKRFIIFNVLFASILCVVLILTYIIANYVY